MGKRILGRPFEVPKPMTPFREVSTGGTRTYGGGTSKEAIRRAKKK